MLIVFISNIKKEHKHIFCTAEHISYKPITVSFLYKCSQSGSKYFIMFFKHSLYSLSFQTNLLSHLEKRVAFSHQSHNGTNKRITWLFSSVTTEINSVSLQGHSAASPSQLWRLRLHDLQYHPLYPHLHLVTRLFLLLFCNFYSYSNIYIC